MMSFVNYTLFSALCQLRKLFGGKGNKREKKNGKPLTGGKGYGFENFGKWAYYAYKTLHEKT